MSLLDQIRNKAKANSKRIVFPEAERDIRILSAARSLAESGYAIPILLGEHSKLTEMAKKEGGELSSDIEVQPVNSRETEEERYGFFKEKLAHKNPDESQLKKLCEDPLYTAGWFLETGRADGAVAGSVASTGQVIVSALRTVGVAKGSELVSSTFLMEMSDGRAFTYADCAVVPYPDASQLASIAVDSSRMHQVLTGSKPVTAFLSFSTLGSARHERVDFVKQAVAKAKELAPDLNLDGELQFDTALLPAVANRKAPNSEVAGRANVFIFPNLDAGNIAYKITERLAGASATGPLLQGLARPYMDLSRGCSVQDIVNTACVASLLS
ncbi:MAG: phosphotransacetylase [Balneolaceae bacterium]|nr:phosphotransacetylase [Balneolaceae bacterium]MCH8548615.1 phosphotransacetylase [Balneolaceae bacterium]